MDPASEAKAVDQNQAIIAALKHCATQNQVLPLRFTAALKHCATQNQIFPMR
jgi:hypothetical protein